MINERRDESEPPRYELGAMGYGPDGRRLAERLCEHIRAWNLNRAAQPDIAVYPADSAHDLPDGQVIPKLEALKAGACRRLVGGQGELDLGLDAVEGAASRLGPLEIVSSRMGHLWDGLCAAYDVLGFDQAGEGVEVFQQLVRIIEPSSKQDGPRVLAETGMEAASYATTRGGW